MKKNNAWMKEVSKQLHSYNDINEIIHVICDKKIGKGLYRDTYILKQNPNYVVKIERKPQLGQFSNVTEWRHYIDNQHWKWLSKWLATCEIINETGQILIQERVYHRFKKYYPTHIPSLFTDLKIRNFGFSVIDDRFVCCDYSYLKLDGNQGYQKAKWWGEL